MNLKKFMKKDRHGNMMSFEFDMPQANVPSMNNVPTYDHPGNPKGTDTVPAWLTPGEFVVNKEATDMFGPIIEKINNIGRKKQKESPVYAQDGTKIGADRLEQDELFQTQLNKMLEKYQGPEFSKEKLYKMIAGESSFDPTVKNPKSSATGLFQFTDTAINDLIDQGKIDKDFTTSDIAGMSPADQLALYETYLDRWKYGGDAHLGIMQAAPGAYFEKFRSGDNKGSLNQEVFMPGSDSYKRNKVWAGEDGKMTFASISDYYDKKSSGIPGVTTQEITTDDVDSGAVVPASAELIPPVNASMPPRDMSSMEPIEGPTSGNIAQLMGNLQPSAEYSNFLTNLNANKGFMPNQNVTLDTRQIPGVNRMMDINQPPGTPIPTRAIDGKQVALTPEYLAAMQDNDMGGVGSDSSMYKLDQSAQPMTYPQSQLDANRMMDINVPPVSGITSTGNWPPSANTSEYNFGRPSEASIAKAEMDEKAKQQQYMENFSPKELEKYIPQPEFDYRAAQEKQLQKQHDFLNMKEWDDFGKVSNTLVEEYGKGIINEEEYKKKLELAEDIKQNKENRVLNQWERKANNQRINEKLLKEKELRDLRERLNGTVDPKLKAAVQKMIGEKEKEVTNLDESIVKNVTKDGWSTDIVPETEVQTDDPNVFTPTKEAVENLTTTIKNTDNDNKPGADQENNVKTTGESQPPAEKKKAEGFLKGLFGNLFNKQELARAAIMYLGSRAMGYGHGGSLNFALKQYIGRVDAKEAAAMKFATSAGAMKAYTAKSLADYARSGDVSDLKPLPKQLVKTANTKVFYGTNEKGQDFAIPVTEFKVGTGKGASSVFLDASGREHDERNYSSNPMYNEKSPEYEKAMVDYSNDISKFMGSILNARTAVGKNKDQTTIYSTDIVPAGNAGEVAAWALKHEVPLFRLRELVDIAVTDAHEDRNRNYRATTLVPYLNSLLIRQKVKGIDMDLFTLDPETKMEEARGYGKPVEAKEFERLRQNAIKWIQITEPEAIQNKSLNEIQIAAFAELTEKWALVPAEKKKEWNRKASDTTTGFMEWSKQSINNVISGM